MSTYYVSALRKYQEIKFSIPALKDYLPGVGVGGKQTISVQIICIFKDEKCWRKKVPRREREYGAMMGKARCGINREARVSTGRWDLSRTEGVKRSD